MIVTVLVLLYLYYKSKNIMNKPENKDPKNYSKEDFFRLVLGGLNVPVSDNNLNQLLTWANHEGGDAHYNPLNTTKVVNKGETDYNSAHVKNYPDFSTGVDATVRTLKLNYYAAILDALRQDKPTWKGNSSIVAALNTWGTTNYANALV